MKIRCRVVRRLLSMLSLAIGIAACSGSGSEESSIGDAGPQITGQVRDALTGDAVRDASVRTDPPTEQAATAVDGNYTLRGTSGTGGRYRVFVDHFGYVAQQSDVSVIDGEIRQVDFLLAREASGLVASVSSLQIPADESGRTFRLTSTVADADWSVTASEPWVQIEPRQGRLSRGEIVFVTVDVQRSALDTTARASAEIALNGIGLDAVVIDVLVDPAGDPANPRQADCRLLDILRVGFAQYEAPLVRFPATARLPFDEGPRFIELPSEALFDSFIVDEPGDVTVTHVQGGLEATTLELFELAPDDSIRILARADGRNDAIRRGQVRQGLVPGVYCYALYGSDQPFMPVARLHINIDYEPLP